jgi:iron complex outermembrane receptor protein
MNKLRFYGASATAFAVITMQAPASAQQAGADIGGNSGDGDSLQEVVVSSRMRIESRQDIPMSVAVIGGDQLRELNLATIQSLQSVTAGLVIRKTPNNNVNLTLRGLGTGSAVDSFEQSVATFIDGAYAGRGQEFNAALFDFDRVEVMRGAQASLLSKNTSLGAISLTTRKPGKTFSGDAYSSHDFELGSNSVEAGVDIPLSDRFQMRVAAKYDDQHGWIENDFYGDDVPRTRNRAGRVVLHYTPTDSLDATLLYQHFNMNQRGLPFEQAADPTGQIASLAALAGDPNFVAGADQRKSEGSSVGQSYDDTNGDRAIATLNYTLGNGFVLTSATSYSEFDSDRYRDTDFIVGDYINNFYDIGNRQLQQEVRLTSPVQNSFMDYVVGASYFRERWLYDDFVTSQCPNCSALQLSRYVQRGSYKSYDDQLTRDDAAFAQLNLHFTSQLTVSGGLRYTHDNREATLRRDRLVVGPLTTVTYPPFPETTLGRKENNVDGSISVDYKHTENLLLYVSAAKGTKGGGFINFATNPTTPAGAAAAQYGNEKALTYELGEKWSLPRGGFVNVALFNTDIDDFQQAVFISPSFITTQRDLRSRGVEAEAGLDLMEGVRLQSQVTYADTERKDAGHFAPPGAPRWSGNVNLSIRKPLTGGLTLTTDTGAEFRSELLLTDQELTIGFPGAPNNYTPKSAGYAMLNARIGLKSDSGWEAAFVGRNLNNKMIYDYAGPTPQIGLGSIVATNPSRSVSLQLGYRF